MGRSIGSHRVLQVAAAPWLGSMLPHEVAQTGGSSAVWHCWQGGTAKTSVLSHGVSFGKHLLVSPVSCHTLGLYRSVSAFE